jgi:hypothetical protein
MTTAQKYEYKNAGFNAPWDPTTSITAYFTSLDCFQISLVDGGIATSDAEKTMAAGAQMWNSEMFTENQMPSWENKPAIDQTWPNLQTYFTKKWLERKQYLAMTAKQSRFKEAALFARETAAVEVKGETQAMLFAMLQEQHNKQMATMAASNKANMDAMVERMNMLVSAGGGRRSNNKENTPPVGTPHPRAVVQEATKPRSPSARDNFVPTAKHLFTTPPTNATSWRQTRTLATPGGRQCSRQNDIHRGPSI